MLMAHDLPSALVVFLTALVAAIGWHIGGWTVSKLLSAAERK